MFEIEEFNRKDFYKKIKEIIYSIPYGKVCTYGTIAAIAGRPMNSRMVGRYLSGNDDPDLPAYRVVNHKGRTVPGWSEQRILLEFEGVKFKDDGCVNLKKFMWFPEEV